MSFYLENEIREFNLISKNRESIKKYYNVELENYVNLTLLEEIKLFRKMNSFVENIEILYIFRSHSIKP